MSVAELPVSLAEAQAFLRLDSGDEEALLAGLLRTATSLCESFLCQALMERAFEVQFQASCAWQRLAIAPVRSIDTVMLVESAGTQVPLPSSSYSVDIDSAGDGWVRLLDPGICGRLRASGTAGLTSVASDVPEPIRQGILRLVAHLFGERDGPGGEPPAAVTALWRPYRRTRLA